MNDHEREVIWIGIVLMLGEFRDADRKINLLQTAIAEYGPVPAWMEDVVRKELLRNELNLDRDESGLK